MNTAIRALGRVPLIGPAVRGTAEGKAEGLILLAVYALLVVIGLVWQFGYPALIVIALSATAFCLVFLVVLTAGDVFTGRKSGGGP